MKISNLNWGHVGKVVLGIIGLIIGIIGILVLFVGGGFVFDFVVAFVWTVLSPLVAHYTAVLWGEVVPFIFAGSVKQGVIPASLDHDQALGIGILFLIIAMIISLILILRVNITINIGNEKS